MLESSVDSRALTDGKRHDVQLQHHIDFWRFLFLAESFKANVN